MGAAPAGVDGLIQGTMQISGRELTHTHHTWAITPDQVVPTARRVTKVPDTSLLDANIPTRLSYLPPPGYRQLNLSYKVAGGGVWFGG